MVQCFFAEAFAPSGLVLGSRTALVALARSGMRRLAAVLGRLRRVRDLGRPLLGHPFVLQGFASYCFSFFTLADLLAWQVSSSSMLRESLPSCGGPHPGPPRFRARPPGRWP